MCKKAIYGGTFDPVHLGHLYMVEHVKNELDLSQVIFMPCWQSPFKDETVADEYRRFEMLQLAIKEMGFSDWASVSDYEASRAEKSYSWQTATHFSEIDKETDWCWILGTDQWDQIDKWAEPEKLRTLLRFIVVTRDHDKVIERPGWEYTSVPFHHPASSSEIRENWTKAREWLPESVLSYCEKHRIYNK